MINGNGLITAEKLNSFIEHCTDCEGFADALRDYRQKQLDTHAETYDRFARKLLPDIHDNAKTLDNSSCRGILTIGELLGFGIITGGDFKADIITAQGMEDVIKILKSQDKVKGPYLMNLDQIVRSIHLAKPETIAALKSIMIDPQYAAHPKTRAGYALIVAAAMHSRQYQ